MASSPRTPNVGPSVSSSLEVVSTSELQRWMSTIETYLNDVCAIATEGKLNSDQKLKISNLCRKVGNGTSQMAVLYQSLKQKAIQVSSENEQLKEKCDLTKHISDFKQTIQESCGTKSSVSFADMVKKGSSSFVQPANLSSIVIYPQDKLKTSDDTKVLVQKIIRPQQMKLQVRGVRKTKNGGVIISTETKVDAEKLRNAVQQSTSGLTADEPLKRRPRVVVIGVPSTMAENEVLHCIYEQNLAEKITSTTLDSFLTSCKLSHKSGKKNSPTCNYVIEVPADIRKTLITQTRLFINWTSCPVRDFTLVTRCYNCHQYGHAAKSCREATPTCGHCAETGHSMPDCPNKEVSSKCATCRRFKKPHDHKTGEADCPARKAAEFRYINSVDYEGA